MLKNYEMVFISPIGPIGINSINETVSELKFDLRLKKINSKDFFYKEVSKQLDLYFNKKIDKFDIPFTLSTTEYQTKVLKEVLNIKHGSTKTYSDIAVKINTHPRPVGNACRNYPIQLLIPCYRVVGKNNIGGFSGENIERKGNMLFIKKKLLMIEKN